jgi:hypothetical protein
MNVRNETDVKALVRGGWKFVTVSSRGDHKGLVCSKHKTRKAAEAKARDKDLTILDVTPNLHWQF